MKREVNKSKDTNSLRPKDDAKLQRLSVWKSSIIRRLVYFSVIYSFSAFIIFSYEVAKSWIFPDLNVWESHVVTIIGISIIVTIAAYFISKRQVALYRKIERENLERKKAEEKLAQLNKMNQLILNSAAEGILGLDSQGNHTFFNRSAEMMLGFKTEEFANTHSHILWHHSKSKGKPYPEAECFITDTLINGKVHRISSEVFWRKNGTSFPVTYSSTPIYDKESLVGAVVSFVDTTESKRAQEKIQQLNNDLEKQNATKDKLFTIIAHDLRNPFNSILGFSELLSENIRTNDIKKSEEFSTLIYSTAKHTITLLENLLAWAKMQTGQIDFKPENLHLSQIVQEVIEVLNPSAKIKNIRLNYLQLSEITVHADPTMLKTVLRNLISNAIKFTNTGGTVEISAVSKKSQIVVNVSDNGVGMDEETQNKLFILDTTITTNGTANERGSGLGLLLCKEFVEIHQGKIWVESEVGKGSDFKFTLPFDAESDDVNVVENIVSSGEAESQIKNLKILITDDDEASRKFLGMSVKLFAKEILYAQNGFEAVVACKENPDIDLILMDIKMPEMDGFEATHQIRQTNKKVIIIVQSAFTDSGEKEKAKEAGSNDFLTKPINKTLLKELIKKHFDN
jgi:two-component system, sensor histidine kinase and response regulator